MDFIKRLDQLSLDDTPAFGGKNASLGQLMKLIGSQEIMVPMGFAVSTEAYALFLKENQLDAPLKTLLGSMDVNNLTSVHRVGQKVRHLIEEAPIPDLVSQEIAQAYQQLCDFYKQPNLLVAVRSSATAEDLPTASFAGQQESFLGISGSEALFHAYRSCMASLFTDRALIYRHLHGFSDASVGISVGIQKMVRSDLACAGVAFSLDPDSGCRDLVVINASWGLGELLVKGRITPDEYRIYRPLLKKDLVPIIKKTKGEIEEKLIYQMAESGKNAAVKTIALSQNEQDHFCLTDKEIIELAQMVVEVERCYATVYDRTVPMDIEWAKDGIDGKIYLVQARPETVYGSKKTSSSSESMTYYSLQQRPSSALIEGQAIGQKIASGSARIVTNPSDTRFKEGDVLVAKMTDPDWLPLIKKAAAVVTDLGGRTCHAAIVSRELGIPAVIGTRVATSTIKNGEEITIDCSQGSTGYVYEGKISYQQHQVDVSQCASPPVEIMVNLADPEQAFTIGRSSLIKGVGLARIEFIIANTIKIHPMACAHLDRIRDEKLKEKIKKITAGHENAKEFFVQTLAHGIGTLAAGFYPRPVIVRFSDFKTNEYARLVAGDIFEQPEANPMLGLRGASRYYSESYKDAFVLECEAIKQVRNQMGLTNLICMIPFVRTVAEAEKVIRLMADRSLSSGTNGLKVYMMVEIPSNIILLEKFAALFDGFSIGSNDLTQFVLAVDRDSASLAPLFDERDEAVQAMMVDAIARSKKCEIPIGICGQAPSDYPELADALIKAGISSLSLNPDTIISFVQRWMDKNSLEPI